MIRNGLENCPYPYIFEARIYKRKDKRKDKTNYYYLNTCNPHSAESDIKLTLQKSLSTSNEH